METKEVETQVSSTEDIVRLLSRTWVEDGIILHTAFKLRPGESYLSVNRPAVESFGRDVSVFIASHSEFSSDDNESYQCARLNVGDVRNIDVQLGDTIVDISVEVESRAKYTKSHAGIFTRFHNQNIKSGAVLEYGPESEEISTDIILLDVPQSTARFGNFGTASDFQGG